MSPIRSRPSNRRPPKLPWAIGLLVLLALAIILRSTIPIDDSNPRPRQLDNEAPNPAPPVIVRPQTLEDSPAATQPHAAPERLQEARAKGEPSEERNPMLEGFDPSRAALKTTSDTNESIKQPQPHSQTPTITIHPGRIQETPPIPLQQRNVEAPATEDLVELKRSSSSD